MDNNNEHDQAAGDSFGKQTIFVLNNGKLPYLICLNNFSQ